MARGLTLADVFPGKGRKPVRVETMPRVVQGTFHLDRPVRKGRFAVSAKGERTIDGHVFDSKIEATRYIQLRLMQRAGMIDGLELQPAWDVLINGHKFCRYSADFTYFDKERGCVVIEDAKSSGTQKDAAYRLRKKAAELAYGIKVTEVVVA